MELRTSQGGLGGGPSRGQQGCRLRPEGTQGCPDAGRPCRGSVEVAHGPRVREGAPSETPGREPALPAPPGRQRPRWAQAPPRGQAPPTARLRPWSGPAPQPGSALGQAPPLLTRGLLETRSRAGQAPPPAAAQPSGSAHRPAPLPLSGWQGVPRPPLGTPRPLAAGPGPGLSGGARGPAGPAWPGPAPCGR